MIFILKVPNNSRASLNGNTSGANVFDLEQA